MFNTTFKIVSNFYNRRDNLMSAKTHLKLIKDKQVEFVDLRFTDPKGKLTTFNNGCNSCRSRYVR